MVAKAKGVTYVVQVGEHRTAPYFVGSIVNEQGKVIAEMGSHDKKTLVRELTKFGLADLAKRGIAGTVVLKRSKS